MSRLVFLVVVLISVAVAFAGGLCAAVLVDLPLDRQVNLGTGDAITGHDGFGSEGGVGYLIRNLTDGNGAGGWYDGPRIDLVKAGYGPGVDLSRTGARIQYTARYFQGGGNTDPYGDAPIFINLVDADGTSCDFGISYGPTPDPTYPEWITVTENLAEASADLDLSAIVSIGFFGTDWSGTGDDFVQIRHLKFLDDTVREQISIPEAKSKDEEEAVHVQGSVSALFPLIGRFYIQDASNFCGIQVRSSDYPQVGQSVYVWGILHTDPESGEMYIDSSGWIGAGSGQAQPRHMRASALGGIQVNRQAGATGGRGPNNLGLRVKVAGKVTAESEDATWAAVSDGSTNTAIRVSLAGMRFLDRPSIAIGRQVTVTGISSVYLDGEGARRPQVLLENGGYSDPLDDGNGPRTLRVAVFNFDPYCPAHGNRTTHEVFGWNDPHALATGYINDLNAASGGWCNYEIVDWVDVNYHAPFQDGFQWNPDDYVTAWQTQTGLHDGTADYVRLLTDSTLPHNQPETMADRILYDEIDEVFFFGAPTGSAFWEASMAGPSPFFVNGGCYDVPQAGHNFVVMGFNYERDVDCMLEDFLHRTECVMSRVYPSPDWWFPTFPPTNNWDKFRMIDMKGPGESAVGMCHFAPNSESDYDWGNSRYVWSTCDDWLYNWPNLLGGVTRRWVNCSEWGDGDMRLHHVWWLNHLPKAPGLNSDGRQNNWWKYTCDFSSYHESR